MEGYHPDWTFLTIVKKTPLESDRYSEDYAKKI